jgi:biotin carboxylase
MFFMKECIIILGAGVMQGPAIQIAKELDLHTVVLDNNAQAPCISKADQFEQIDLKDKESIENFARELQGKCDRLGIMTAGTDFSASVAWAAEKLGLPGYPYETALNASDKSRMRSCFARAGVPSPEFFTITSAELSADIPLLFPLVIKPVDNMGSRGCRRVDTIEELREAAEDALRFSRSGRAIVEAFMEGPEFSVDAIVYHGKITICGLADRHIFFPPYFIEMGHTMPTVFEPEMPLLDVFCQGIRALGLADKDNVGAAKGDIKMTGKGPMIGEIAARLSGGYMSGWTYPYASGVHPTRAAILAAMGKEPDGLNSTKNWVCAERAFISIPGKVRSIHVNGESANQTIPYSQFEKPDTVSDIFMRITEGSEVSFPQNNVSKCGNVLAYAPGRESAVRAAESQAASILVRLEAANRETGAFLANSGAAFPPDAFILNKAQNTALSLIPDYPYPQNIAYASIYPFPGLNGLCDYMGRSIENCLNAVRALTGFPLTITEKNAENKNRLGRSFWQALIRGSYQGAVYYIDNGQE